MCQSLLTKILLLMLLLFRAVWHLTQKRPQGDYLFQPPKCLPLPLFFWVPLGSTPGVGVTIEQSKEKQSVRAWRCTNHWGVAACGPSNWYLRIQMNLRYEVEWHGLKWISQRIQECSPLFCVCLWDPVQSEYWTNGLHVVWVGEGGLQNIHRYSAGANKCTQARSPRPSTQLAAEQGK